MSFGKDSSHETPDLKPRATASVIARETHVTGEIGGSRALRVEGTLKGNIQVAAPVDVVEGATIDGEVTGTIVRIAGTVNGNVTGKELVELQGTAMVRGDIRAATLHVVEGAKLEGRVQMSTETTSAPSSASVRGR